MNSINPDLLTNMKNQPNSIVPPRAMARVGMMVGMGKKITLENNTSQPLYFLVSNDPNALRLTGAKGAAGTTGGSFEFQKAAVTQVVQKLPIPPGRSSVVETRTNTSYITVLRKKSNGKYAVLRDNRSVEAGGTWRAGESDLVLDVGIVDEF